MLRKGCTPETLHSWHRKYLDSQNPSIVEQRSDKERIKQLERENRELRQANEIIRKAAGIEAQAEKGRKPK
jgi:transposase-like protein